jgi:hypothetical protein
VEVSGEGLSAIVSVNIGVLVHNVCIDGNYPVSKEP